MLNLLDESVTNLEKSITTQDPDGNAVVVVQMSCKIEKLKGIQYYMRVEKPSVFENQKEAIQIMVNNFKAECEAIAKQYNVPII